MSIFNTYYIEPCRIPEVELSCNQGEITHPVCNQNVNLGKYSQLYGIVLVYAYFAKTEPKLHCSNDYIG
jgi:hypothetical protein